MNEEAYKAFWHFINERHLIWVKRNMGLPKPWTEDPILRDWKFCNVFRVLDKQSQFLIKNVIDPHIDAEPDILLFNIFMFRAFNWWPTYEAIGWTENFDANEALEILSKRTNQKLTSGAYMMRGREGMPKYQSILITLGEMWWGHKKHIANVAKVHNRIEEVTTEISSEEALWGWADFTAYQVALDLTYSPIMPEPFDLNTWCAFGPGAERGIKLIYPELKPSEYLDAAITLQKEQAAHLEDYVPNMTLQDIEFSLCELQKYMRIASGGRSKEKFDGKG